MSIITYAAYSNSDEIRYNSSSGGVFSELAKYVYNLNGVVVGAAFDDGFKSVSHILTNSIGDLDKLTTSKYVQSHFHIQHDIEEKLKDGKVVLCCGTPCQIAGLKHYLKNDYDNLITIDFVCHGTPVQTIWKKYIEWQEEKNGEKVTFVNFRSKENGWSNYLLLLLLFESGKRYSQTCDKDPYMQLFLQNVCLSKGCFNCQFKGENSYSDITLGDFWGIDSIAPELNDGKGISLVSVKTEKGVEILETIKDKLFLKTMDENLAYYYNSAAINSVKKPKSYDAFFDDLDLLPFDKLAKKYISKPKLKERLKKYKIVKLGIKLKNIILKG